MREVEERLGKGVGSAEDYFAVGEATDQPLVLIEFGSATAVFSVGPVWAWWVVVVAPWWVTAEESEKDQMFRCQICHYSLH